MTKKAGGGLTRKEAAELRALKLQQEKDDARPAPTEDQAKAIERATERWRGLKSEDRTPPKIGVTVTGAGAVRLAAPFNDDAGWSALWAESLGTNSPILVDAFMRNAGELRGVGLSDGTGEQYAKAAREAAAFVAAVQPRSEMETALALQMCAAHEMTIKLSGHAFRTSDRNALSDYNRMMNQTMRTFTAQVEALAKLRGGGKQQVEVRHVYIDARNQTYVAGEGGSGGHGAGNLQQPHAPGGAVGYAPAESVPLRGQDEGRHPLPVACSEGAASVSDARREKPGRSEGRAQRQLRQRPVDRRDDSCAGLGSSTRPDVQGNAS